MVYKEKDFSAHISNFRRVFSFSFFLLHSSHRLSAGFACAAELARLEVGGIMPLYLACFMSASIAHVLVFSFFSGGLHLESEALVKNNMIH